MYIITFLLNLTSIVSKVIVGGYNEDGTVDPYKITFVLKGMENACITDAKNRMKKVVNG